MEVGNHADYTLSHCHRVFHISCDRRQRTHGGYDRLFAVNPEIDAATGCHSPKPSGAKSGAITPPMTAIRLSEDSTKPKPSGPKP